MKAFDFDGTLYDGDSSVDFFVYCLRKQPRCLLALPQLTINTIRYLLRRCSLDELKSSFFYFTKFLQEPEEIIHSFWKNHSKKIKTNIAKHVDKGDLIISASPSFLLREPATKLGAYLVATEVDIGSGRLVSKNCKGAVKAERCIALNLDLPFEEVFSDSMSDMPLFRLSQVGHLVKKDSFSSFVPKH